LATLRQEVNTLIGRAQYLPALVREIVRIVSAERCTAIVACTGNLWYLPAAHAASRALGLPLIVYIFDYYSHQHLDGALASTLACDWERTILPNAAHVIVTNEVLADELSRRYRITPVVLHNPCDLTEYANNPAISRLDDKIRIVFTGAVYEAQADALTNLCAALEQMDEPRITLHLYSRFDLQWLERYGRRIIFHGNLKMEEIVTVQQQADILFLPLAFQSRFHPLLINTSLPSKFPEYLAARRPILVHAPADSFPALYCRQHGCGLVVDERDPGKLAAAIRLLVDDMTLRQQLTERAWERACADFDLRKIGPRFAHLFNTF